MELQARKYVVKSMTEAMCLIKRDLGNDAVILHKKRMIDGFSSTPNYFEVTATAAQAAVPSLSAQAAMNRERVRTLERELKSIKNSISELVNIYQRRRTDIDLSGFTEGEIKLMDLGFDESIARKIAQRFREMSEEISMEKKLAMIMKENVRERGRNSDDARVFVFLGPTGVGKTTTLAKISSALKLERPGNSKCEIVYICLDSFRLGAGEQLKNYAQILDSKTYNIYDSEQLIKTIEMHPDAYIFIDTCGRSQLDESGINETFRVLRDMDIKAYKYLVMSAVTKYEDMLEICNSYGKFMCDEVIITKVDETTNYGNVFSLLYHLGVAVNYFTNGQEVPKHLVEIGENTDVVEMLFRLGGINA
ncbi:MAG: hypothetical protein PHQ23_04600 [Candidatus Wallbacteria bacterium]|nr:hypothetical protein [Candidatus Wallbacteria bacterium]